MEWTLPTVPRPVEKGLSRELSLSHKDNKPVAPEVATSSIIASSSDSKARNFDSLQDETSESFAFALVKDALRVFQASFAKSQDSTARANSGSQASNAPQLGSKIVSRALFSGPNLITLFGWLNGLLQPYALQSYSSPLSLHKFILKLRLKSSSSQRKRIENQISQFSRENPTSV
ncbi:hypothetical protein PVK06_005053 [Gossypium arboreum]|uniref:WDR11 second beta-propeller domain-containing protein n=1 Tax=Gossypium arboreum TaxID=29729 RepID=A0ABR0QTP2_GOSAR|nr:hypothetical protein PVK06_005053 [Gossypium arboreum]